MHYTRKKPHMFTYRRLYSTVAVIAVALSFALFATVQAFADTSDPQSDHYPGLHPSLTQHKPGYVAVQKRVPTDAKLPNGAPHPCAGRYLLYHDHIDTTYATMHDGKLKIMTVAGSAVVPSNEVCIRLGPDANEAGVDRSHFIVNNDPVLSFLGRPGTILWSAPADNPDFKWIPIWAGLGAFDTAHEHHVPTDFVNDKVTITLKSKQGPGDVDVFNYSPSTTNTYKRARIFHSSHVKGKQAFPYSVGMHSHTAWTFSKPGIYHLNWQASAEKTTGEKLVSPVTEVIWLVGTDTDVALAPGTTPQAYPIRVSAEKLREQMGISDPEDPSAPPVSVTPGTSGSDQDEVDPATLEPPLPDGDHTKKMIAPTGVSSIMGKEAIVAPGTYTAHINEDAFNVGLTGAEHSYGGGSVVVVPDGNIGCAADNSGNQAFYDTTHAGWLWSTTPQGDNKGFSFSINPAIIPDIKPGTGARLVRFSEEVPPQSRAMAGSWQGSGKDRHFDISYDSANEFAQTITLPAGTATPIDFAFTRPGVYTLMFSLEYTTADDQANYYDFELNFVVGNSVINSFYDAVKDHGNDVMKAGVGAPLPLQTLAGKQCNADGAIIDHPKDSVDIPALEKVWGKMSPCHVVTHGHQDLAIVAQTDGRVIGVVKDSAVAQGIVYRPSGSFIMNVPTSTKSTLNASLPGMKQLAADHPGPWYQLPQSQEDDIAWLGFSDDSIHPNNFRTTTTSVAQRVVAAPDGGRLVLGTASFTGFTLGVDSAHPEQTFTMNHPAHHHPMFLFTKPGVYVVDYIYTFAFNSGQKTAVNRVTFAVGDTAIKTMSDYATGHSCVNEVDANTVASAGKIFDRPGASAGPDTPAGPGTPVGPNGPGIPAGPGTPDAPAGPGNPGLPDTPTGLEAPTSPLTAPMMGLSAPGLSAPMLNATDSGSQLLAQESYGQAPSLAAPGSASADNAPSVIDAVATTPKKSGIRTVVPKAVDAIAGNQVAWMILGAGIMAGLMGIGFLVRGVVIAARRPRLL